MSQHDQRCTKRADDWKAFGMELVNTVTWIFRARESVMLYGDGHLPPKPRPLHKGWNILVEEWRRLTGKCPQEDESKESGV